MAEPGETEGRQRKDREERTSPTHDLLTWRSASQNVSTCAVPPCARTSRVSPMTTPPDATAETAAAHHVAVCHACLFDSAAVTLPPNSDCACCHQEGRSPPLIVEGQACRPPTTTRLPFPLPGAAGVLWRGPARPGGVTCWTFLPNVAANLSTSVHNQQPFFRTVSSRWLLPTILSQRTNK